MLAVVAVVAVVSLSSFKRAQDHADCRAAIALQYQQTFNDGLAALFAAALAQQSSIVASLSYALAHQPDVKKRIAKECD